MGKGFSSNKPRAPQQSCAIWASERSLGTSLTRGLLWFKSKSSHWPEGPRDLALITSVTQSPRSPPIMLCLSHCPPHCFHTHYTGFYSAVFPLALPLSRILFSRIGISFLGFCSNVTILERTSLTTLSRHDPLSLFHYPDLILIIAVTNT